MVASARAPRVVFMGRRIRGSPMTSVNPLPQLWHRVPGAPVRRPHRSGAWGHTGLPPSSSLPCSRGSETACPGARPGCTWWPVPGALCIQPSGLVSAQPPAQGQARSNSEEPSSGFEALYQAWACTLGVSPRSRNCHSLQLGEGSQRSRQSSAQAQPPRPGAKRAVRGVARTRLEYQRCPFLVVKPQVSS